MVVIVVVIVYNHHHELSMRSGKNTITIIVSFPASQGGTGISHLVSFPPESVSYWGSYFKYRKSCTCAFWSLGAGAAVGCRCCARLVVVPLCATAVCAWELGRGCCCCAWVRLGRRCCAWELRWPLLCALGCLCWRRCRVPLPCAGCMTRCALEAGACRSRVLLRHAFDPARFEAQVLAGVAT